MANLRIGLVGCGHIAGVHIRAWRATGVSELSGAFDTNQELAGSFAKRHGIPSVYANLDELIEDVDVIDDCSPPIAHLSVALAAISKGCDYLVEKPMVLSVADLEEILKIQQNSGSKLGVIHNLKYNLGVQTAKQWVEEGRIGRIISLERHFLTDPATDRMLQIKRHWSHNLPGGRWVETLPHELYIIHQFLGPLEVKSVQSVRLQNSPHPHTADEMIVVLSGGDNVASLRFSARCRSNHRTLMLHGSDGSIRVELLGGTASLYKPRTAKWVRGIGVDTLNAASTLGHMVPDRLRAIAARVRKETPHSRLISDFAQYLRDEGPTPIPLDEIEYVVRTGEEISRLAMNAK